MLIMKRISVSFPLLWITYTIAKVKDKLIAERNCHNVVVNVGHGLRMIHAHALDNIVERPFRSGHDIITRLS